MIEIGALLKQCRELADLSQADLVNLVTIPITQPEISAIECGKRRKVSFEKVFAMLDAMGWELAIHEGTVVKTHLDVKELRKDFGFTLKKISPGVELHLVTLGFQERTGTMRLNTFLDYLKAMGLRMVLIDDLVDVNKFKNE